MSNTIFIDCKHKDCDCKIEFTPGDSDVSGSFRFITSSKSSAPPLQKKKKIYYLTCEEGHEHRYIL